MPPTTTTTPHVTDAAVPQWPPPSLSTPHAGAVVAYQDGVATLVAGLAHAGSALREAVLLDPTFTLAHVALAVAEAAAGSPFVAAEIRPGLSRGERQHIEVVSASFSSSAARAEDLRREHLSEFPGDLLVVWLPTLTGGDR